MVRIRSVLLCLCAAYVHMMSFGLSGALGIVFIELQELFDSSKAATVWVSSLYTGVGLAVGKSIHTRTHASKGVVEA